MIRSRGDRNRTLLLADESLALSPRRRHATLRMVAAGEVVVDGRRYRLVPVEDIHAENESIVSLLTARELQIVALVADGRVNKQIACDLHISEWTVSTHLRRIFSKLGVDTRAAMVSRCATIPGRFESD